MGFLFKKTHFFHKFQTRKGYPLCLRGGEYVLKTSLTNLIMIFHQNCYLFNFFLYFFIGYLIKQLISRWFPHHAPLWCLFSLSLSHLISVLEFDIFPFYFLCVETCEQKRFFPFWLYTNIIQFHTSIIELYCAYVPRQRNGKRERYKFMYGKIYVWRVIKSRESAIHYFCFSEQKGPERLAVLMAHSTTTNQQSYNPLA